MTWKNLNLPRNAPLLNQLSQIAGLDGLDPHLIWASLTYFKPDAIYGTNPIPVMFEAKSNPNGTVALPPANIVTLIEGTKGFCSPFFTGFVQLENLKTFKAAVERFRIGVVTLPTTRKAGTYDHPPRLPADESPNEMVIGIIDHGIGFANKQFANVVGGDWATRIERIWDQQNGYPVRPVDYNDPNPAQPTWTDVLDYRYGRELGDAQINFWLNRSLPEAEIYRRLQYLPAQGARAHGTHVLGLAAGTQAFGFGRGAKSVQALDDQASKAKIIAVQLPALPYKDTSGTGLCVQILDAMSYITLHAKGRRIVFNLSDGAYAGPHDGSSLLERAIDRALINNKGRHAFVVAAGNQFDEKVHWKAEVSAMCPAEPITWHVLPDDSTDSHLEIWPAANTSEAALQKIEVVLTPPGGSPSPAVNLGGVWVLPDTHKRALAAVIFSKNPPNGFAATTRGMIHVAVAATRPPRASGRDAAPHGIWKVELINKGSTPISFDAYVERDNPALGDTGPRRQSHFVHPNYPRNNYDKTPALNDTGNLSPIKRMGALNNVATAGTAYVVGGYVRQTCQLAAYSASGPGRSPAGCSGVDILAASDNSQHVKGVRSVGVRTGTTFRMDGTSVAAPQATRWIANWMVNHPSDPDWRTAINAASRTIPQVSGPKERIGTGRL